MRRASAFHGRAAVRGPAADAFCPSRCLTVSVKPTAISSGPATITTVSGRTGSRPDTINVSAGGEAGTVYAAGDCFSPVYRGLICPEATGRTPLIRGLTAIGATAMRSATAYAAVSGCICITTAAVTA